MLCASLGAVILSIYRQLPEYATYRHPPGEGKFQPGVSRLIKIALPIVVLAASGSYVYADRTWLHEPEPMDIYDALEAAVPLVRDPNAAPLNLHDGIWRGTQVDAFYGYVEVVATVTDGKLSQVRVAHYPKSSGASAMINQRAMPKLRKEAIAAQSQYVDFVTGATLSSKAFTVSLGAALAEASR